MMNHECVFCQVRMFEKLLAQSKLPETQKQQYTSEFFKCLSQVTYLDIAPENARTIQNIIKEIFKTDDPYKEKKAEANKQLMQLYPQLKQQIQQSSDPFTTALKMAIAGNIIDVAAKDNYDIMKTINGVLQTSLAIDDSKMLAQKLASAETILYLGDNAGEIVLDKLFIETIGHKQVYYAVKNAPILNDVTIKDAEYVGMQNAAKVISNGYDAPSTIIKKCSQEFVKIYNAADLIISKGQGNFEGLVEEKKDNIFFLLIAKCDAIADMLGVKKNDVVVKRA